MVRLKKYLFLIFLIALTIPALQQRYKFALVKPLKGYQNTHEFPAFNWNNWFSGDFQNLFNTALEDHVGFRSSFVRLQSQIDYSLFNYTSVHNTTIASDNFLYGTDYIEEYLGQTKLNQEAVKLQILKAQYVQRELEKRGKHLLILLAPNKASYFPEFIPAKFDPGKKQLSHHDVLKKLLPASGLRYIDFNDLFVNKRKTSPYPLYTDKGVHWSMYGSWVAEDTLLRYIHDQFQYDLPQIVLDSVQVSETLRGADRDIEDALNLMVTLPSRGAAYPFVHFTNKPKRPNLLVIGDSYYYNLTNLGMDTRAFNESGFWYYNKEATMVDRNAKGEYTVNTYDADEMDLAKEIARKDIIILIQTEVSYRNIGFGFIERAYNLFSKNKQ